MHEGRRWNGGSERPDGGRSSSPTVLVTGGQGRLAHAVVPAFRDAGWSVVAAGHRELDITCSDHVRSTIRTVRPDAVVNLGAWTDIAACEGDPLTAERVNGDAVGTLAEVCHEIDAHLCQVSSDYVFGGNADAPYLEGDAPDPISAYGRSKLAGERAAGPYATVARVAWLSGEFGRSFVRTVLDQADDDRRDLRYVTDEVGSPTVASDAAAVLVRLVAERRSGIFHVANAGAASRYELARHVLAVAGSDPDRIVPVALGSRSGAASAPRPRYSALASVALPAAGVPGLRHWTDAVTELVDRLVDERPRALPHRA